MSYVTAGPSRQLILSMDGAQAVELAKLAGTLCTRPSPDSGLFENWS